MSYENIFEDDNIILHRAVNLDFLFDKVSVTGCGYLKTLWLMIVSVSILESVNGEILLIIWLSIDKLCLLTKQATIKRTHKNIFIQSSLKLKTGCLIASCSNNLFIPMPTLL